MAIDFASTGLNVGIIIVGTLIVGIIGVLIWLRIRDWKRYNIIAIIHREVGINTIITSDLGGIFVDGQTNNKRFFLKKNKAGLDPDNMPFKLNDKGQKVVMLSQTGEKNFQYLDIHLNNGKTELEVSEEDVNWGLNEYEKYKRLFGTNMLEKLLPYIGIVLMGLFILGMIMVTMRELKEMLPVLKDIAEAMKTAAMAMAQAQTGTTIIQ